MAEKSIEEKTRRLASQRPENGKEFQQLQGAQNQLLEIQAAQKQNLMEQRLMSGAQAEQNQILAQAAEVGAQSVAGNMQLNQATAGVMGRYGLNQPRTSSQVKQQHRESVTRQNVTIHNNTTNITNNTVPANIGGPIQGRPIQFQQPQASGDGAGGMGKFKNWLNQTFARQEEAAKRRDREYQRREVSLTKSANKMMRKIEEFGRDITKKLDPRNVGRTLGGQLKTILKIIGIGVIAKNFDRILDWIYGAQDKVENEYIPNIKNFFSWIKGEEGAQKPGLVTKLQEGLENTFGKLLFGKDGDSSKFKNKGLIKGIGEYFWAEDGSGILQKAWDKIKEEFKDRSDKAREVITLNQSGTWANILENPGEALKEFFTNLTNYLAVLVGGDAALSRIQQKAINQTVLGNTTSHFEGTTHDSSGYEQHTRVRTAEGWRSTYKGDARLLEFDDNINKSGQYVISKHYLDENNQIRRGDLGASTQVANNLRYYDQMATRGYIGSAAVGKDLAHLYTEARSHGEVLVYKESFNVKTPEGQTLLSSLWNKGLRQIRSNELVLVLRPRPDEEVAAELKDIMPDYMKVSNQLRKMGLNTAAAINDGVLGGATVPLPGGQVFNISHSIQSIKAWVESGKLRLDEQKIVRIEEKRPDDIVVDDKVGEKLDAKGYIWATADAIRQLTYYGYMTRGDREKLPIDDISFDISDKDNFMLPIQRALEMRSNSSEKTYDFNADLMASNRRAQNYQLTAPEGIEYKKPENTNPNEGPARLGAPSGLTAEEMLKDFAAQTGTGYIQGAGIIGYTGTGSSGESSSTGTTQTTSPDSAEPEITDNSYTVSNNEKFIYGAEGAFDPEAAAKWVAANYSERSKGIAGGLCSDFVGMGLRNGGSGAPGAGTVSNLEDYLKDHGWYDTGLGPNDRDLWQVGDVSIIYKKKGKRYGNGHTSMYVGNGYWISDVKHDRYSGGWENCEEIHIYRYKNDPNVSHSGTPGREWNKKPNVNHVKYAVDRWWRLGRSKEKWGGVGALFAGTNGRSYNRVPGDYNEVKAVLENPDSTIADFIRVAYKPITTDTKWSPTEIAQMYGSGVNVRDVSDIRFDGFVGGGGSFGSGLKNFFSGAKEVVSNAVLGLSHKASDAAEWVMDKAGDGVDWDTSLHNGVSTYNPYKKSKAEQYLYARYTGKDNGTYTIPSSISSGTTLKRDEWWAKFFDEKGNLKISKEDNINPTLVSYLHKIEGELKKGNEMNELDLKMAAQGLDAEMVHNAAETRDQKRLISALVATGNSGNKDRVQLFSDNNT